MARIFKGSTYQLQLLVSKCSVNSIEDIRVSFFTTNPTIQVGVSEDITVAGNIATVRIPSNLFDSLDDGVLNYIVSGIVDGVAFITERQSNYYLKTDTQYIPQPSVNIGQLYTEFIDYTGNGEAWWYASDYGVDGFNYVEINASAYGEQKYNQGYAEGQKNSQGGGGSCNLTTLEVTENGTYFPPTTSVSIFDGDDIFDIVYADTRNAIEIRFKVNGSGWILGNNEKVGLFAESTGSIIVYWYGYEGHYDINDGEVNTILIKPYDVDTPITLNGVGYGMLEREIDNTDSVELSLGGGYFDFYYAKFWSEYAEYNDGQIPLFYFLPNTYGNIKSSVLGGDFGVLENRGGGVCQYTEIKEFDGFSRVDVNVEGGIPNIDFYYTEPERIVDMVLNQGFTGTLVIKGQITEVQSIDLNYGNATYFLGDLKVFRGTGLNNNSIAEEGYFQVGDWVVIVGNVSNYNGTAQIDRGSTLVAKWR